MSSPVTTVAIAEQVELSAATRCCEMLPASVGGLDSSPLSAGNDEIAYSSPRPQRPSGARNRRMPEQAMRCGSGTASLYI